MEIVQQNIISNCLFLSADDEAALLSEILPLSWAHSPISSNHSPPTKSKANGMGCEKGSKCLCYCLLSMVLSAEDPQAYIKKILSNQIEGYLKGQPHAFGLHPTAVAVS